MVGAVRGVAGGFTGLASAAGVGVGTAAALVVAAAAIGYGIGTGLRYLWARLQPEERRYRAALAYRHARDEFARLHGRQPNAAEQRAMADGFKRALAEIG